MPVVPDVAVPAAFVDAALRVAERLGKDVADVSVVALAREAGVSRSTLLRRLGGSRRALDEAVRAAGVDPGGMAPVRVRAVRAGGALISDRGLASMTLEAVAAAAGCSVHSLYATFGGRGELLRAIFERYSPIVDFESATSDAGADLGDVVRRIYRLLAEALGREPRVVPAMLAEALARPADPAVRTILRQFSPRLIAGLGSWLAREVAAGRIRELPVQLLIQQLVAPVQIHVLMRPALEQVPEVSFPPIAQVCEVFAEAFLRAVAVPNPP